MARHEFRMTESAASKHKWAACSRPGFVECRHCRALAQVEDGVYYEAYPAADRKRDCAKEPQPVPSLARDASPERVQSRARRGARTYRHSALEADVRGVHLRFSTDADPSFIAAVVGAICTWERS
jgi:hypothetical protein